MNKFLLVIALIFFSFSASAFSCGEQSENKAIDKNDPVSLFSSVRDQNGNYLKNNSKIRKSFLMENGYESEEEYLGKRVSLRVLPDGYVVIVHAPKGLPSKNFLIGRYVYMSHPIYKCHGSPTVTEWVMWFF